MKVLYVIPYPKFFSQHNSVGGHIAHCVGILRSFLRRGAAVRFYGEEIDDVLKGLDMEVNLYPQKGSGFLARQIWLFGFLRQLQVNVGHFQPDVVYMRYSASAALWYPLFRRVLKGQRFILEVNSLGSQRKKFLSFFDRKMLSLASTVVCISELLSEFVSQELGLQSIVVPNGIDVDRVPEELASLKAKNNTGDIQIVYAGLLKPDYGLEFAITALDGIAENHHIRFTLYGDGPLLPKLREMAKSRSWLNLPGAIAFGDIPYLLAKSDILLYPSSRFNQFQSPTKLFEYMAAARPISAVKTKQTEKLLCNGEFGDLFDLDDADSLRESIVKIISNPEGSASKASQARKIVLQEHTWDSRLENILQGESSK